MGLEKMSDINFKFYSILKNEDAMPYYDDHLIVAADGLGGSGSAVHEIDRTKHPEDEIRQHLLESAFKDATAEDLDWYLETLIKAMIDEKDDTSALWASRIVIARCVYALTHGEYRDADLSDDKVRAQLVEFISEGLRETVKKFGLQNGKYDGQLLLPTTLAFIRYKDNGSTVTAETLWAGDSRCYALLPDGLKLLSVDDEDSSGSITNLFYADNKKAKLNYLRHELPKPCVLMAVSDGIFDPFDPHDNLGVEYTLLSHINTCPSIDELCTQLKVYFDKVHADDATMAFVSFGFNDYADLQQKLTKRTEYVTSIRAKQNEMRNSLEVINQSPEDAMSYVRSRTSDKFATLSSRLADILESGAEDYLVTDEIKRTLEAAKEERIKNEQKAREARKSNVLRALDSFVKNNPEQAARILTKAELAFNDQTLKGVYYDFAKVANEMDDLVKCSDVYASRKHALDLRREELHRQIQDKIIRCLSEFDGLWDVEDGDVESRRKELRRIIHVWMGADNALMFNWKVEDAYVIPSKDRHLLEQMEDYRVKRKNYLTEENNRAKLLGDLKKKIADAWAKLYTWLAKAEKLLKILFSSDAIREFGIDTIDGVVDGGKITRDEIICELNSRKDTVVTEVVNALIKHCNEASSIDDLYNSTRLELFRTYFRLKDSSNNGVKELEQALNDLEEGYTSLLKK